MRTTVIPAQITTVEDKIAGNLNLTQILLLMVPVFWSTIVYTVLLPQMRFAWYKLPLILFVVVASLLLCLRIRGKIVLHWLIVLLRYNLRPRYYLFNKNDSYLRVLDLPPVEKKPKKLFRSAKAAKEVKVPTPRLGVAELIQFENMLKNKNISLHFKEKKGGYHVAFEQI